MENKPNNDYKVSAETASWIRTLIEADSFYDKVSEAYRINYGDSDDLLTNDFSNKWGEMVEVLKRELSNSVTNSLSLKENKNLVI